MSQYHFGWAPNPKASEAFTASLARPTFAQAAPHLAGTGEGKDVFFWEAEEKVLGKLLPVWDQGSLGSCVAHGWGRGVQDLLLIQIALNPLEGWEGHEVAREPIYGGSRVQVGGDRSWQDGSVGAWAAKWVREWGVVLYGPGGLDGTYDIDRCRTWGHDGVPQNYQDLAKKHPVKDVTRVDTPEQCRDLLSNLYPVPICGTKGRTMKRSPGGWCRVSGTWNHCQTLRGVCVAKGNRPAFVYQNSWDDYLGSENNVVQLESGREITLPPGCYLSEFDDVASELRQGDTFAAAHGAGWEAQKLSWLI